MRSRPGVLGNGLPSRQRSVRIGLAVGRLPRTTTLLPLVVRAVSRPSKNQIRRATAPQSVWVVLSGSCSPEDETSKVARPVEAGKRCVTPDSNSIERRHRKYSGPGRAATCVVRARGPFRRLRLDSSLPRGQVGPEYCRRQSLGRLLGDC